MKILLASEGLKAEQQNFNTIWNATLLFSSVTESQPLYWIKAQIMSSQVWRVEIGDFPPLSSTWGCTSSQTATYDTRLQFQVVFLFTTAFFKLCDREGSITFNDIFLINLSSQCIKKSENVPVWNCFLTGFPLQWVLSGLHVQLYPHVKRVPPFS